MLLKILITLVLIVQPVFLNENVSRRKLIRRKKHFSHEEKINENENPFFPESRASGPVKVLKRKLIKTPSVNQFKKQLVKRKVFPHILPEQQPSILPSYPNSTLDIQQNIPAKPSDAKRCKIYF